MPAQILFIGAVAIFALLLWWSRETARGRAWKRIMVVVFLVFVVWTVLFPDTATRLANAIGIGRGTDLITYLTAFTVLFMALLVYLKFRRLDQRLATVTRELALAEWDQREVPGPPPTGDEQ